MQVWTRTLAIIGLMLAAAFAAATANAQGLPGQLQQCHAYTPAETDVAEVATPGFAWICGSGGWRGKGEATWLRFDMNSWRAAAPPRFLSIKQTTSERLAVFVIGSNGRIHSAYANIDDLRSADYGPYAAMPLPRVTGRPAAIYARYLAPKLPSAGSEARIVAHREDVGWAKANTFLLVLIAGMVCAPLLLNIGLFVTLRRGFMLAHVGMAAGMLLGLASVSGLAAAFADPAIGQLAAATELAYVLLVGSAGVFAASFIEDEALARPMRRAVLAASLIIFLVSGGVAAELPLWRDLDHDFYYFGFVPMLAALLAAVVQAVSRRSRWVWYIIAGWLPLVVCVLDLAASGLGIYPSAQLGVAAAYCAMGFELLFTGLGVIHRVMLLRRERDAALRDRQELEELSVRDPLTGVLNRRALEPMVGELVQQGYTIWALLDLDRFKSINDQYGHRIGDEVLKVVAAALDAVPDSHVVRMGGEEFLLLLRGPSAQVAAERGRLAITRRVLDRVDGLDQPVTASMGVLDFSAAVQEAQFDFATIYSRVDDLLYQAKRNGRNRSVNLKLELFDRPKPARITPRSDRAQRAQ